MAFWARCMFWGHHFPSTVKNRHTLNSMYSCMFWFGRYSYFIAYKKKILTFLRPIQYGGSFFFLFGSSVTSISFDSFLLTFLFLSVILMCPTIVILLHRVEGISTKGREEPLQCYRSNYLELYGSVTGLQDVAAAQPQLVEQDSMVVWGCASKLLTESRLSRCSGSSST